MARSTLKLLGLCAAVFGVMAISAGAAQAETGAKWLILTSGGILKDAGTLPASIDFNEVENKTLTLLTEVLKIKIEILCTAAKLIGAKLEGNGSITNGFKIRFTGCVVKLNGVLNTACEAHSGGSPVGTIETLGNKGLIVLHQLNGGPKDELIRIEPSTAETIVTINMGPECPAGETLAVKGKLFLADCQNQFLTHLAKHLVEEGPLTHLFVISDTPEHALNIDGSFLLALTGDHLNLLWAGDPA